METIQIILCVLVGLAIVAQGVVSSIYVFTGSKERRELQKLLKARDLPEYVAHAEPQDEPIEEDENLVELENIDSVINKK